MSFPSAFAAPPSPAAEAPPAGASISQILGRTAPGEEPEREAPLRVDEVEPAFAPDAIQRPDAGGQGRQGYASLAALVDSRVKRQTDVAAFALLAIAALAVIIFLALTL